LIEISVSGADLPNSVFAHENCCLRIMHKIANQMRQLLYDLAGDGGAGLRRHKNCQVR
jgi:hypothetical protein